MINQALMLLRKFHFYSEKELANRFSEISEEDIINLESGKLEPTIKILESYGIIFDVSINDILKFSDQVKEITRDESVMYKCSNREQAKKIIALAALLAKNKGGLYANLRNCCCFSRSFFYLFKHDRNRN